MEDWKAAGAASDGKADTGKTMMSLLFTQFGDLLRQTADVLTFGAIKYPAPPLHDSWKRVPDAKARYTDAMLRHFDEYFVRGEILDPESGKSHLAHMMCNLHFIFELDKAEAAKAEAEAAKAEAEAAKAEAETNIETSTVSKRVSHHIPTSFKELL